MTLPSAGPIDTDMIRDELRVANPGRNYPLSLTDPDVLALAGKGGPPVVMPDDFYGKSAYTPMTVQAVGGASGPVSSDNGPGVVAGNAVVMVSGGVGPFGYQWTVMDSSNGAQVGGTTGSALNASRSFTKNSSGSATVTAYCTVSDSTGRSVVSDVVQIELYWGTIA